MQYYTLVKVYLSVAKRNYSTMLRQGADNGFYASFVYNFISNI